MTDYNLISRKIKNWLAVVFELDLLGKKEIKKLGDHIAALEIKKAEAERGLRIAKIQATEWQKKYEQSMVIYAERHQIIKSAFVGMGHELGKRLGEELMPHAQTIMKSRRGDLLQFEQMPNYMANGHDMATKEVKIIRGSIPSLHYQLHVL